MSIEIKGLHEVTDLDRLVDLFYQAFYNYPKLEAAFPQEEVKNAALKATLYFYCAYDLKYGKAYALDDEVNEAVIIVESQQMQYTKERYQAAGCYSAKYQEALSRLTPKEQEMRIRLFEELDMLEEDLDLPDPHLYVDFLAVDPQKQRQGRGRKLMNAVCEYAEQQQVPIMLFTNTKEDVLFYQSLDFQQVGEVHSKLFGFHSWYLVK